MKKLPKKNLYKVTTSYDGDPNFDSYRVIASSGLEAAAYINANHCFNKRQKVQKEVVDEVELISHGIDFTI